MTPNETTKVLNDSIIDLNHHLKKKKYHFFAFKDENVADAITQKISALVNPRQPYLCDKDFNKIDVIDLGRIKWNIKTHQISFKSIFDYYKEYLRLVYRFGKILIFIAKLLFNRSSDQDRGQSIIINYVGGRFLFSDNSLEKFKQFCKTGIIPEFKEDKLIYVAGDQTGELENIRATVESPYFNRIRSYNPSFIQIIGLLLNQTFNLLRYHLAILKNPHLLLLNLDIASLSLGEFISKNKLASNIYYLHSESAQLPIWVNYLPNKTFKSNILWYSVNSRLMKFTTCSVNPPQPLFLFNHADNHWTWTEGEKQWVKESLVFKNNVHAVGPILFAQYSKPKITKETKQKIIIFDTHPYKKDYSFKDDTFLTYITLKVAQDLLVDTCEIVDEINKKLSLNIEVVVKPKKRPNQSYVIEDYYHTLDNLINSDQLKLLNIDSNIPELVSHGDLVIAHPFSSTAKTSALFGVPAFYYDPTGRVLEETYDKGLVTLINGKEKLKEALIAKYST